MTVPFGNYGAKEVRGTLSGPLSPTFALSVAAGRSQRDGYTVNDATGNPLDNRSSSLGKVQVLWTPASHWEARAIVSAERGRDGDYALQDLGSLRSHPFHAARDFEGFTNRDVVSTTFLAKRVGQRFTLSTTTGMVRWKTQDVTDLDYSPFPAATRDNAEESLQFTQEVRLASSGTPIGAFDGATLKWQAGAFLFTQGYDQNAVNAYAPFVTSPFISFQVNETSPQSSLADLGLGIYGQGTLTFGTSVDVIVGARFDHERKDATLSTFYQPQIAPPTRVDATRNFTDVSPQVTGAYRFQPGRMVYASLSRGYKAGGFNAASPVGTEAYEEEHAWHVEGGVKTSWANGRVTANAAVFHIDWDDLQLNVPNPAVLSQFYVANVGAAQSTGIELEVNARPTAGFDLFGVVGYTHARFGDGSVSSGVNVSQNNLPSTPPYTATLGAQYSRALNSNVTLYGRGEAVFYGSFFYDDFNSAEQEAYSLTNLRAGARARLVFVEAWVRNALDTRYIPVVFPFRSPSGFIGEMGRPRTFGVTAGETF